MPAHPKTVDQHMRDRISMARMLCVLGMIFVHVPDGFTGTPIYAANFSDLPALLEGFLVEGPGRASAALLSVVSGYLAATALLKPGSSVKSLYKRRFKSICIPMILWASVTWVVYYFVSYTRPTFVSEAQTLLEHLNIIFFLTEMPLGATMHLGFLRDLFVCVLLSPLLLMGVQRAAWIVLPCLALFYLLEHDQSAIIILRPLVVFAFTIGLFLAVRQVNLRALDNHCPVFIVLAIVSTFIIMFVNGGAAATYVQAFADRGLDFSEVVLYPIGRLFGSLAIWTMLPALMGGRLQDWVSRFSPYLFAAFCSHYLMLTLLFFGAWMPLFGDRTNSIFIVWFLASPLTAMLIAVIIVQMTLRVSAPLATLITGGRIGTAASKQSDPLAQRQRQGVVLGAWLAALAAVDSVVALVSSWFRGWFEASRRLLLGRR